MIYILYNVLKRNIHTILFLMRHVTIKVGVFTVRELDFFFFFAKMVQPKSIGPGLFTYVDVPRPRCGIPKSVSVGNARKKKHRAPWRKPSGPCHWSFDVTKRYLSSTRSIPVLARRRRL